MPTHHIDFQVRFLSLAAKGTEWPSILTHLVRRRSYRSISWGLRADCWRRQYFSDYLLEARMWGD